MKRQILVSSVLVACSILWAVPKVQAKNFIVEGSSSLSKSSLAQVPTGVDFGTSLRDGIARENRRYSNAILQINQQRSDASTELKRQRNRCTALQRSSQSAYVKCLQEAELAFRERMLNINDKKLQEDNLHHKIILAIQNKWWDTRDCDRPDGCRGSSCCR